MRRNLARAISDINDRFWVRQKFPTSAYQRENMLSISIAASSGQILDPKCLNQRVLKKYANPPPASTKIAGEEMPDQA